MACFFCHHYKKQNQMALLMLLLAAIMNSPNFTVTSNAFKNNENIPSQYTCEGANETPSFTVSGIPAGTKSIAFIMDDPDAPKGNFDHWVLFNIDANGKTEITIDNSTAGTKGANGKGENKYTGPCPPTGKHHYHFKAYALDAMLDVKEGASKKDVEGAMNRHILAQEELIGLYEKMKK
jgi:Raf kinase inhibitor-like YbhB/YbcL family protein